MKWELDENKYQDKMSEAFVGDNGKAVCTLLKNKGYSSSDFAAIYNELKIYFSLATMDELDTNGFNFSYVKFYKEDSDDVAGKTVFTNGITLEAKDNADLNITLQGIVGSFNKAFLATTPGYVLDTMDVPSTVVTNTLGSNVLMEDLDITIRDILINLCPSFEDNIIADGEQFFRGDIDNFMGYQVADETGTRFDQIVDSDNMVITGRIDLLAKNNFVKYTNNYTSFNKRFTINGVKPSVLGVSNKAIAELYYDTFENASATSFATADLLSTTVGTLFTDDELWEKFYTDEDTHFADIARIYNDPAFYKMTNECVASVDAMILKQPEVGFESMVGLISKDVELTNEQYDALVTTNNFEYEPESEIYGEKINNANYCIVDKLKTVANGTQSNEGYFITIVDPYDALKLQRLLVNPFEDLENVY
jgi:hypothetical protein